METPEVLQKKLYFLLEQLQNMARDLPPKYQMRLPIELLSSLANCLLNDTIFEIVKGLLEIQHVTEQHLYQQRLQYINNKKSMPMFVSNIIFKNQLLLKWATEFLAYFILCLEEEDLSYHLIVRLYFSCLCSLFSHQLVNFLIVEEQEILNRYELDPKKKVEELKKVMVKQKEELKKFDMNLVLQLDEKVADQQQILEQAGVPGFYVTTNPLEIKVQMYLLDFMLRLSKMSIPC